MNLKNKDPIKIRNLRIKFWRCSINYISQVTEKQSNLTMVPFLPLATMINKEKTLIIQIKTLLAMDTPLIKLNLPFKVILTATGIPIQTRASTRTKSNSTI